MTTDGLLSQLGSVGLGGYGYTCGTCGQPVAAGQPHDCSVLKAPLEPGIIQMPVEAASLLPVVNNLAEQVSMLAGRVGALETTLAELTAPVADEPGAPRVETLVEKTPARRKR